MAGKPAVQVNMHDAKTHLSRYVARAQAGETVVIAKGGKPVAKLVPVDDADIRPPPKSIVGALVHLGPFDDEAWRAMDKEIEDMFMDAIERRP